jgi:hypothetical protein
LRKRDAITFIILALLPSAICAQTTEQSFQMNGGRLHASISVSDPPSQRIIESLRDGLESEVRYVVRVYEHTGGFLGFFGDRVVGEYAETYRAKWDEFSGDFILSADGRPIRRTISAQTFLAELFNLTNVDTGIRLNNSDRYYVLSDVKIQIVKLVPPLTMIAPFLTRRQLSTLWVKTELHAP